MNLEDLLAENITMPEQEPQLWFNGQLVFSHTPKKRKHPTTDIASWMEAFSIFYLILCSSFPHRWRDLTSYNLAGFAGWTMTGPSESTWLQKKSLIGLRCMFSSSTTIQLALKFALARLHPELSRPRQGPLVMLLVESFAILGMLVIALQLIHSVGFAMHVAGAGALIMLPLVLLHHLFVLAHRILRSQSAASAINCFCSCYSPYNNFELLLVIIIVV